MKQKLIFLALTLCMLNTASMKAQVLIGGSESDEPHEGAVLDLSQSTKLGLLLPQVFLTNVSDWQLSGSKTNGEGMLIYNTNDDVPDGNGKDIYVWTRNSWKPIGPVTLKRFSLDKSLLFLDLDSKTGTITAQNFTGSNDLTFDDVTVTWSIAAGDVPKDAFISYNDNTAAVVSGNTAGSFTVRATINGITQDCVVTISECAGVMDVEGNAYYAAQFGTAGCWMTQNLRTKTYADGETTLTLGSNTNSTLKFYNYPNSDATILTDHPEYGLLYTWPAATNRAATSANEANSSSQTQYQGICPTDWHLPSDYEWLQLEEEIANSMQGTYGTGATTSWQTAWATANEIYRPSSGDGHGCVMKSATEVNGQTTNGTSHASDANGFNALLVGMMENGSSAYYGQMADFWASSSISEHYAPRRFLYQTSNGMYLHYFYKYFMTSVRCKKN
ncbi:MAG: fibrobacter succinogenes major paralogous domain-containing protein [Dysgonamonadaceae bacterium]|jgi:uncharacterized protein (TIGR02145 family)|nr:fibrobacter succinogenes major paralogous domain-containing protein [Dysgonamonadaceae bacterium]